MKGLEIPAHACQSEQTVQHISSHKLHTLSPCGNSAIHPAECLSGPGTRVRRRDPSRVFSIDSCSRDVMAGIPFALHPEENRRGGVFCSGVGLHTRHDVDRLNNRLGPVRCPQREGPLGLVFRHQNPVES
jgi:hypothetical protein